MVNVVFFAVPCIVLAGIYFVIGKALRSHDILMASVAHQNSSRSSSDADSRVDGTAGISIIQRLISCNVCVKTNSKCEGKNVYFQIPTTKRKLERFSVNGNIAGRQLNGCDYIEVTMANSQQARYAPQTTDRDLPPIAEDDREYYPLQATDSFPSDRTYASSIRSSPLPQSVGRATTKRRSHGKLIVMLGTVVFVFFICWLPLRVMALWQIFVSTEAFNSVNFDTLMFIILCSRLLVYINSSINPLLYNLISSKFRRAFKYTVSCREMPAKPGFSKPPSSSSVGHTTGRDRKINI